MYLINISTQHIKVLHCHILYPVMPTIEVDTGGIAKEIDPCKAMGPDEIPPQLLKELSSEIAPCLSL